MLIQMINRKKNQDENVHRFALRESEIERERER